MSTGVRAFTARGYLSAGIAALSNASLSFPWLCGIRRSDWMACCLLVHGPNSPVRSGPDGEEVGEAWVHVLGGGLVEVGGDLFGRGHNVFLAAGRLDSVAKAGEYCQEALNNNFFFCNLAFNFVIK